MNVYWTQTAINHLSSIHSYIHKDSPIFASRIVDKIINRTEQISAFPRSGRKVQEYDTFDVREVIEGTYRIIYHIKVDQIDVLAVIHCAQLLPEDKI